jgi:predicted TIM-barrel fold metal-dependent hydrolase
MNAGEMLRPTPARPASWTGPVIDVDVHAVVPSLEALMPYLPEVWRDFVCERNWGGPVTPIAHTYPPNARTTARPEWRPGDGRTPASSVELLREHVLDPWVVDYAILNCYYAVEYIRHPDVAAALASAVNDWLIAEWLDQDPRLRASMVIPAYYPDAMIREIKRVGAHPGIVQVFMPVRTDRPYGNRLWHPVYEVMAEHGLVMGIHWGGTADAAPSPTGWPSSFAEEYAAEQQLFMAQLTSLVAEGAFAAVRGLRVAVHEIGFAWLPSWFWRMDAKWKGLRRDIPWVSERPAELVRERVRFSAAPIDAGPRNELRNIVEWLGTDELLMFATDYPHGHDDDLSALLDILPEAGRAKLMADNAREWYRL